MNEEQLGYFAGGEWRESKTTKWMDCYDPSTGEVIAQAPQCTGRPRSRRPIGCAADAFPAWADTPAKQARAGALPDEGAAGQAPGRADLPVAKEHGKVWDEAMGDVLKVTEVVEFACGIPHLMKGPALMNCTSGYDTTQYMEPLGVFAGIAPWNFPAMIPMGWMAPLCIATGNTLVLKAASFTPQTAMRICELWEEAGLPKGVINLVTCSRNEAEILLRHPDVKGCPSSARPRVGRHIYATAAANGKRVQALPRPRTTRWCCRTRPSSGRPGASSTRPAAARASAAWRCPWSWREEAIADELVALLEKLHERAEDRPGVRQDQPARARS